MKGPYVAVCGAGWADPEQTADAEAVGRELAKAGAVVVCGGLGGVMAAACKGAAEAGGLSLGILPGTDRSEANPWCTLVVPSGLGDARNAFVVRCCDALIAIGGEWGTLSEIALAMKAGVPVIGLDSWELPREGMIKAATPEDAVRLALSAAT